MMKAAGMVVEDSMSNLTSGSNDASISSGYRLQIGAVHPQQQQQQPPLASSPTNQSTQPASKKKRNLPGNPGNKIQHYISTGAYPFSCRPKQY